MIKDSQEIKAKTTKLYSIIRRVSLKVSEISASTDLFNDEIGELYQRIISRLFNELSTLLSFFEDDFDDNLFLFIEQNVLFPDEGNEEFSIFLYRKLFNYLLEEYHDVEQTPLTNALENHFLDRLIGIYNSFNDTFYQLDIVEIPDIVRTEYEYLLNNLNEIFQFNFVLFFDEYGELLKNITPAEHFIESLFDKIPSLYFIDPSKEIDDDIIPYLEQRFSLKKMFLNSRDWHLLYEDVYSYINECGYGELSYYYYFEWNNEEKELCGYEKSNTICLEDIVGYETQKKELLFNTEAFLNNYPANNVLIYGYRGCGKTSMVNALLEKFKKQGLRLVKITKEDMSDLPLIVEILSERKEKFIISPDDLSYEEFDPDYKKHKVIIDTVLDRCPNNVIIYATSNTQELVKFNKRFTTDDIKIDNRLEEEKKLEVMDKQLYDERRALTDRFGLTLLFGKPNRETYTRMLFLHAKKLGISISTPKKKENLIKEYEAWTLYHGTPCGRSAANFVGYYSAKRKR